MYDLDDCDLAKEFHHKTVAILDELSIAATPVNYAVLYVHISRRNKSLSQTIIETSSKGMPLDDEMLRDLFDTHLIKADAFEKELMAPFDNMIGNVLSKISAQSGEDEKLLKELDAVDAELSEDGGVSDVSGIVSGLVEITQKAKSVHSSLASELDKATNEINLLKEKLKESEKEAVTDSLTGLLNRRGFYQRQNSIEDPESCTCLVMDIDHFKKINDTYGHLVGDRVIKRVAQEIKDQVRGRDLVVRFGGEEFIVILVDTPIEGAEKVAEMVRVRISELKLVQRSANITLPPITISVGVAAKEVDIDWKALFGRADEALYQAKQGGRNQTRVFSPEMSES